MAAWNDEQNSFSDILTKSWLNVCNYKVHGYHFPLYKCSILFHLFCHCIQSTKLKMYQTNIIQCICNCKRNIVKERKIDFHQPLYFVEDLLQNSDYTRGCWQCLGKDEDGMSTIHQYFNIKAEIWRRKSRILWIWMLT